MQTYYNKINKSKNLFLLINLLFTFAKIKHSSYEKEHLGFQLCILNNKCFFF